MKKLSILCIALLLVQVAFSQSKVGTIDINYILSKMPEISSVQANLKEYGESLDSTLQEKAKDYQTKLEDYNKNVATYTEEQAKEKQTTIIELEDDISKFRQNGLQLMRIKEDELKRPLYSKIAEVLDEIAKEKQYTQILDISSNTSVVFIDPNFDITLLALSKLGIEVQEKE